MKISQIISGVEHFYDLPRGALFDRDRSKTVAEARSVAMYMCHKLTNKSYPELGDVFHRDHSTVVKAIKRVDKMLNPKVIGKIDFITHEIQEMIDATSH